MLKYVQIPGLIVFDISAYESWSEICEFISVVVHHIGIYFRNYGVHIHGPG